MQAGEILAGHEAAKGVDVVAAGRRPVTIYAAALWIHELACRAVFHRAQLHAGDAVLIQLVGPQQHIW